MRIAIAGISHEALTFSPVVTRMGDLVVLRGREILDFPAGTPIPHEYGVAPLLESRGIEPVPILVARSFAPSGTMEEATYLQLRDEIAAGFRAAGPLDGILLILHGALLVENVWSGETDLVRTIRAVAGNDVPIAVRLDLHANLTAEFASKVQTWAGFRTAPHRDAPETLARALDLLVRIVREGLRPRPAFVRVPLLLQGERATTGVDPMKSLLAMARAVERQPGILNAEVLVGFGWADAPHAGANVAVVAEDDASVPLACREARRLAQAMWDRRDEFTFDQEVAPSIDDAIDRALAAPEPTVFLSDSGDNPTAGAPGDATAFLARLLERRVPDAIVVSIADPEAVEACFEAGAGATVRLSLGGKMDAVHGAPLPVTATVEHLYRAAGAELAAGMATVRVGGVFVVVTSIRTAFFGLDDFRKAGLEALAHKIVVVKLGYLMPELRDAAPREILVLSPGYADMDLARLPYRYVIRPIHPLDGSFEWQPVITSTAGTIG